ncbi:unnamed protein product, partial [Closterium sp. Naga37s-1]
RSACFRRAPHAVVAGASFLPGPPAAGCREDAAVGGVGGGMGGAVRVGGVVRALAGRQSAAGGDASVVSHARAIPPAGHPIVHLPRAGTRDKPCKFSPRVVHFARAQSRLRSLPVSVSPSQSHLRSLTFAVSPSQSRLRSLTFSASPRPSAAAESSCRHALSHAVSFFSFAPPTSHSRWRALALLSCQTTRSPNLSFAKPLSRMEPLLLLPYPHARIALTLSACTHCSYPIRMHALLLPHPHALHFAYPFISRSSLPNRPTHRSPPPSLLQPIPLFPHTHFPFLRPSNPPMTRPHPSRDPSLLLISPPPPPLPILASPTSGEAIGLVSVLGHFGPRSSSNLSYWGLAGCVNNNSMSDYNLQVDVIGNFSTGTILMIVSDQDRPLVESIIGHPIQSVLGLPAPKKDLYGVNVYGSINPDFPVQPFTDFFPLVPLDLRTNLLKGQTVAGAPLSTGPGYVAIVFLIPIFRHPLPASASLQQIQNSISIAWAGVVHLEMMARELLHMLET